MKRLLMVILAVVLLGQSSRAWAAEESTGDQIGYGTASLVGSAVYFPFKAAFCILGGVSSGFALLVAGGKTAEEIASTTCRGTWVITPDALKGKERVQFVGKVPAASAKSSGTARSGDGK